MTSSLNDNFCSSPWFHLRVDPNGSYRPCRWGDFSIGSEHTIANTTLTEYLQSDLLNQYRAELLEGKTLELCKNCQYEQSQGKISGRQKQLTKSGILPDSFDRTFCASPHWDLFEYSHNNQGKTKNTPTDLQIDLGNTCNSSCIMCPPRYSSRVTEDYKTLHQIEPILFKQSTPIKSWSEDKRLVKKFVDDISTLDNVKYIHFLGGETLYIKSFYDICNQMIQSGLSQKVTMGMTTNCTVYDDRVERIIRNFKKVHLGLSIEAVTSVNDYIRWPSKIDSVLDHIHRFLKLRKHEGLFLSFRITPNIFSIYHLDQMFDFMLSNSITAESCNILYDPSCLRMELLSNDLRYQVIDKLIALVKKHNLERNKDKLINRRIQERHVQIITDTIYEYIDFMQNYKKPDNIEEDRNNLVKFLHAYESMRKNKILDYLPEYEEFLRSIGYQA